MPAHVQKIENFGLAIIEDKGTRYAFTVEHGLWEWANVTPEIFMKPYIGDKDLEIWSGPLNETFPYLKFIEGLKLACCTHRTLVNFNISIEVESELPVQQNWARITNEQLADDRVFEKVRQSLLSKPPNRNISDFTVEHEGRVGELIAAVRKKYPSD